MESDFDFEQFFFQYSELVYDWLIYQLFVHQNNKTQFADSPVFGNITDPYTGLADLAQQINSQTAQLFSELGENPEFETFINRLTDLGFSKGNANFEDCPFYARIMEDVRSALA